MLVQQLVVILVFSREEVSSTAATPPSFPESRAAFSLGACCLLPQCLLVIIPFIQGAQVRQPLLTSGIGKCLECCCKG